MLNPDGSWRIEIPDDKLIEKNRQYLVVDDTIITIDRIDRTRCLDFFLIKLHFQDELVERVNMKQNFLCVVCKSITSCKYVISNHREGYELCERCYGRVNSMEFKKLHDGHVMIVTYGDWLVLVIGSIYCYKKTVHRWPYINDPGSFIKIDKFAMNTYLKFHCVKYQLMKELFNEFLLNELIELTLSLYVLSDKPEPKKDDMI